jgi:hypothetical protein
MPRLTYEWSGMSCAARWAISSRVQPTDSQLCSGSWVAPPLRSGPTRAPGRHLDDAVDEDARGDDALRVDLARSTTRRACTIGAAAAIAMIGRSCARSCCRARCRGDRRPAALISAKSARQPVLEHVARARRRRGLLAFGERRADARWGVEGRDAGAPGADALGERALRHELELGEALAVELGEDLRVAPSSRNEQIIFVTRRDCGAAPRARPRRCRCCC